MELEQKLRNEARALLEQDKADYILGFEQGSLKFTTTPLITKDKEETNRLVINPFIANNLSVFLTELKGKVGIIAKGCDSRSIVSLIQDNKVVRKDVTIIAIPCSGLIDLSKVEKLAGKDKDEIDDISRQGDRVMITLGNEKKEFPASKALFDDCLTCEYTTAQEYDILIGEPAQVIVDKKLGREKIAKLEETPAAQRWEFWKRQFSRCIRCYACREVCPACFCKRCFVEETEPQWTLPIPRWQDNLLFQMTRVIHTAGRCADCGECERACPVNIPLRSMTKKMDEIVYELFQYRAGTDKTAPPLLTAYEYEEAEDLIR